MLEDLRVTGGLYEIQASMYTVIHNLLPVDAILLLQIRVKTRFDVVYNWLPAREQRSI